jgi:hypothetical protein
MKIFATLLICFVLFVCIMGYLFGFGFSVYYCMCREWGHMIEASITAVVSYKLGGKIRDWIDSN